MGLRPTLENQKSPVAYARGSERKECYRAATVRESVPWQIADRVFNGVTMGPAAHQS
jgi:hypothetical protein